MLFESRLVLLQIEYSKLNLKIFFYDGNISFLDDTENFIPKIRSFIFEHFFIFFKKWSEAAHILLQDDTYGMV